MAAERPDASLFAEPNTIRMSPGAAATDKAEVGCAEAWGAAGDLACATFTGFAVTC